MKFKALIALLLLHSVNSGLFHLQFVNYKTKLFSFSNDFLEWKPFSNETVPSVDGITAGLNHQGKISFDLEA